MPPRRLLLLSTFAGGCLSGAVLIAIWPREIDTRSSSQKQPVVRTSDAVSSPIATTSPVPERALPDDAADTRTEPGTSVADLLAGLEAAYRQGLAAAAPAHAPSSDSQQLTATASIDAQPTGVPAPVTAHAETHVVLAVAAPVPAPAPQADAQPTAASPADPGPVASRDDAEPRNVNVHIGDDNHNTHVGDVIQGDVYVLQQLSVPGYFPYLGPMPRASSAYPPSPAYPSSPAYPTRGATPRSTPTFASSWTVPNDRLGYDSHLIPMLK